MFRHTLPGTCSSIADPFIGKGTSLSWFGNSLKVSGPLLPTMALPSEDSSLSFTGTLQHARRIYHRTWRKMRPREWAWRSRTFTITRLTDQPLRLSHVRCSTRSLWLARVNPINYIMSHPTISYQVDFNFKRNSYVWIVFNMFHNVSHWCKSRTGPLGLATRMSSHFYPFASLSGLHMSLCQVFHSRHWHRESWRKVRLAPFHAFFQFECRQITTDAALSWIAELTTKTYVRSGFYIVIYILWFICLSLGLHRFHMSFK